MTTFNPLYIVTVKQGAVESGTDFTQHQTVTTFRDVQDALQLIQRLEDLNQEFIQFEEILENKYNGDNHSGELQQDFDQGVDDFFERFHKVHPRSLLFKIQDIEDLPKYECIVESVAQ